MSTNENPHAGQGPVVLDIGAGVGAVVVWAPAALDGAEIEICREGSRGALPDEGCGWWSGEWRGRGHPRTATPAWPHVAVVQRPTSAGARFAAVFPGLRAGRYELWLRPAHRTALNVTVSGGEVTEVAWPTDGAGPRP